MVPEDLPWRRIKTSTDRAFPNRACVTDGAPPDLANVIAPPLLFAQGAAFDIHDVAAWARD